MRSIIFLPISLPFMWQATFLYFFAPASIFSYLTLEPYYILHGQIWSDG